METLEKELSQFLTLEAIPRLKCVALVNVMGLTGSDEGCQFILGSDVLLSSLLGRTTDKIPDAREMAVKSIINVATEEEASWKVLKAKNCNELLLEWFEYIIDHTFKDADLFCQLISNLTRTEKCAENVSKVILKDNSEMVEKLLKALCTVKYNEYADLHYLAEVLANLSQNRDVRNLLMNREQCLIQKLMTFTEYKQSAIRRHGAIGTLRNCCFDTG